MTESTEPKPERARPDWERIEADYRAGVLSNREIAASHGVSHTAIQKRAKRDGWTRDLAAKIRAKADALVSKEVVSKEVSTETAITEREVVEANAHAVASIRLSHRKDIARTRTLCLTLTDELEAVSAERLTVEQLQDLRLAAEGGDEKFLQKARDTLNKVISLPARAGTLKALSDALKTLVTLEREAWGLEAAGANTDATASDIPSDGDCEAAYRRMLSAG